MARTNNTVYISIQLSKEERDALNEAVRVAGLNRNRFIRNWIQSLTPGPK